MKDVRKCDQKKIGKIYLLEQGQGDASSQKLTQVLGGEVAKSLENFFLDLFRVLVRGVWTVWDGHRRKIGAINRIVNGQCDLKLGIVIDHSACDSGPHRLKKRR